MDGKSMVPIEYADTLRLFQCKPMSCYYFIFESNDLSFFVLYRHKVLIYYAVTAIIKHY